MYIRTSLFIILNKLIVSIKITLIRVQPNIAFHKIIKRGLIENITSFFQASNKFFSKKKRQINKDKQKTSKKN